MIKSDLWNCLLKIKTAVDQTTTVPDFCSFREDGHVEFNNNLSNSTHLRIGQIYFNTTISKTTEGTAQFQLKDNQELLVQHSGQFQASELNFLKTYLPFCFLAFLAKNLGRTISVAHFAQTLDGKIATNNGDSKWIGNRENLIHAHRMRALCDGILIGNKTLKADQPKLTVRHVNGQDPQRIVLGTSHTDFSSLTNSGSGKVIVIGSLHHNWNGCLDYIQLDKVEGIIPPQTILRKLYKKNINSIYIEGGASTTSCFLNKNAIDILQLHIAPLLFGSGKNGINLPIITEVKQAIQFKEYQFHQIGSEIMFTGFLSKNGTHD